MPQGRAGRGSIRLDLFRVAKGASLVDLLVRKAEIGDGRSIVPLGNIAHTVAARRLNLPPLLCRVVFVRQPALGIRLNLQRVGLSPVRCGNQIVMSALRIEGRSDV